jgi:hypothetical protein
MDKILAIALLVISIILLIANCSEIKQTHSKNG